MINVSSTAKRRRLLQQKARRQLDFFLESSETPVVNREILVERIEILVRNKPNTPDGRRNNKGNGIKKRKRKK
jgi:hypothetical protein